MSRSSSRISVSDESPVKTKKVKVKQNRKEAEAFSSDNVSES
jgi:hypothetical protein